MKRFPDKIALTVIVAVVGAMTALGQLPIPVPGQNPAQGGAQGAAQGGVQASVLGGGRGGRGGQPTAEPVKQVVTPIPTAIEVTGPGEFYETFMDDHDDVTKTDIPAKDAYAKFNYEA